MVEPLTVGSIHSGFFGGKRFADDPVVFNCALLLQNIDHARRQRESLCVLSTPE